jgi:hypothetical protein
VTQIVYYSFKAIHSIPPAFFFFFDLDGKEKEEKEEEEISKDDIDNLPVRSANNCCILLIC